jgi:hypothetical protein
MIYVLKERSLIADISINIDAQFLKMLQKNLLNFLRSKMAFNFIAKWANYV